MIVFKCHAIFNCIKHTAVFDYCIIVFKLMQNVKIAVRCKNLMNCGNWYKLLVNFHYNKNPVITE